MGPRYFQGGGIFRESTANSGDVLHIPGTPPHLPKSHTDDDDNIRYFNV